MDGMNYASTPSNGAPAANGSNGMSGFNAPQSMNMGFGAGPSTTPGGGEMPAGRNGEPAARTLWMGDLDAGLNEARIMEVFRILVGDEVSVKIIRDKNTGHPSYAFVEFGTVDKAKEALGNHNGKLFPDVENMQPPMGGAQRVLKLNWASGGGLIDRRDDRSPEYSIFVGDLGPEVNEYVLVSLFQARFPSCKSAKIMTDPMSGASRGYGFVRFSDESDQQRALVEMQGVYCGNRPMRISTATPKNKHNSHGPHGGPFPNQGGGPMGMGMGGPPMAPGGWQQQGPQQMGGMYAPPMTQMNQFTDPNNTTVFVGGLSGYVTEDELRSFFQGFGEITYVKIPPGKGCGFVQFVHRHAAEMAINQMQGYPIGNSRVRLSWGRSQNNSGIGTPYRPAPPPPHYMGMPPSGGPPHMAPFSSGYGPSPPGGPGGPMQPGGMNMPQGMAQGPGGPGGPGQ